MNKLKISLIVAPLALVLVVVAYVYSLWAVERKKADDLPIEAVAMMMRDIVRFHEKRGGFPADFGALENVVWKPKERQFSINNRGLQHGNYYYFYTRIGEHLFTLWAIPTGDSREAGATWFLTVSPNVCKRWKGAALPLEQIDRIEPNPTLKKLGVFGLIEQPAIDLKNQQKAAGLFTRN